MRFIIIASLLLFGMSDAASAQKSPTFTLHNTTAKSIRLWIPNYMNPNLSPFSKSGVQLKVGQKIYFKYKGRKRILTVVSSELDGQTINVKKLIKQRKREIDEGKS